MKTYKFNYIKIISLTILLSITVLLNFNTNYTKAKSNKKIYEDGIYTYQIINNKNKELSLININLPAETKIVYIKDIVMIDNIAYSVKLVDLNNTKSSDSVEKMIFADSFQGTVKNITYKYKNLDTIEFLGNIAPENIEIEVWNGRKVLDILIIIPEDAQKDFGNYISSTLYYYNKSDLTEKQIKLKPTIIIKKEYEEIKKPEYSIFYKNNIIYKVTKSGENRTGKVTLIGLAGKHSDKYLALPKTITNNEYKYNLTSIDSFGLVNSMANIIKIPSTVTKMKSHIFDKSVKVIFLSKNCKVLPKYMFFEGANNDIEFISIPEGVTTISDNAFNYNKKSGSVILPKSLEKLGKNSLVNFKYVTFINQQPIAKISSAISKATTVKVNKSAKSAYKKALSNKYTVIDANKIKKTDDIKLNISSLKIIKNKNYKLFAKLKKTSNEKVYWISSDNNIVKVSNK